MVDLDTKYLFPAYPIMHIGLGDNYIEYPLSKVLGSWGITIRELSIGKNAELRCYGGENGEHTKVVRLEVEPFAPLSFDFRPSTHYLDLILRYERDEQGKLLSPKWIKAIWMNFAACIILDAIEQKSHLIRFIEDDSSVL